MGESEGEIEYLDEDEEIVNQCVQNANKTYDLLAKKEMPSTEPAPQNEYLRSLQADRSRSRKRRRSSIYEEADSDYDPTEDIRIAKGIKPLKQRTKTSILRASTSFSRIDIRSKNQPKKVYSKSSPVRCRSESTPEKDEPSQNQQSSHEEEEEPKETISEMMLKRHEMEITIPDYEDPLCLPVRVVSKQKNDRERLRKWNDLCLRYYQRYSNLQRDVVTSTKELSFRSRTNPLTSIHETSVWGKVICKDKYKRTKVEEYRGLLPNYREVKLIKFEVDEVYPDPKQEEQKTVTTVILSKETLDSEDCMTAYKSEDAITAVYNCVSEKVNKDDPADKEIRKILKERAVIRMCPTCYQMSNRPAGDVKEDKPIQCAVCSRNFTSAYNLIRHVKTHGKKDVLPKQKQISGILANMMNYHYNCRICNESCLTIVDLRKHVKQHKVSESFDCEVCSQHVMAG